MKNRPSPPQKIARIAVKVSPKASRNAITGWHETLLKLAVTAAPERGRANAAVEELLADALDLPKSAVRVIAGETSKTKQVEIVGLELTDVLARLSAE